MSAALRSGLVALLFVALSSGLPARAVADVPLPPALHPESGTLVVHLSPTGDDARSGTSPAEAVRTLARVQAVVQAGVGDRPRNVTVLVAPGTYRDPCVDAGGSPEECTQGASVAWSFTMPTHTIELRPRDEAAPCPVFDGAGTRRKSWLWVRGARGQLTNLVVTGLRVQHYWNAVTFAGSTTEPGGYNGGNILRHNVFVAIGANPRIAPPDAPDQSPNLSFSAVGLTNSRKNIVEHNTFADIVTDHLCPWLHALYIAHHASGNWIDGNTFVRACGNPVRIRDASHGNVVVRNVFVESGFNGYYEEWFSVPSECHSEGNVFAANVLASGYGGVALPAAIVSPRQPAACNALRREARVRVARNRSARGWVW